MTDIVSTDRFQKAFESTAADRAALKSEDFVTINVDIPTAVTTVLGSLPEIRAQRAAIVEQLPKFDVKHFDHLEDYTFAVAQAHGAWVGSATPVPSLVALNEQALATRDMLMSDASALAKRGLVDAKRIAELKSGVGYRAVAFDIIGLTTVLLESWSKIEGKTALAAKEIDDARVLANKLLEAVGLRDQAPVVSLAAADARMRAYALFFRAYDEVRSAIQYLRRRDGDADSIAPSLYAGRGGRGKKTEEPTAPAPAPAPVSPTDATQPMPAIPHTDGLPNASPFATT